jgi:hypothetical protein
LNEKKRNTFIERLRHDFHPDSSERSKIRRLENQNNRNAVQAIINDISTRTQDIKFVKIMVMMYADTKAQLSEKYKEVQMEFESFGGFCYDVNCRQKEAFLSMQPFG